jgi:galactose mutarotase-like enzyme
MNRITTGHYKDQMAIVLEGDLLKVAILPEWGSKIASLLYKPLEHELLWQNPGTSYRKTVYGDPYERGEASGFDEMFPTISRCFYERQPWSGVEMPDHGEVWSLPWDYEPVGDRVRLRVHGVRFPYQLEKEVSVEGGVVRMRYRAENLSSHDLDFIWAAHPLFNAVPGMRIVLPGDANRVVNSVPSSRLGPYAARYDFPMARLADGSSFDLSEIPEKHAGDYQKYWFPERVTEGWCILHNPGAKLNIGMAWPPETVPYLGMWVNEGGWADQYNVAPEPATGGMDRVDAAGMWGMNSVLRGGETLQWWLSITVSEGERPRNGPLGV